MGVYINPPGQSKEAWLEEHGLLLINPPVWPPPQGFSFVCHVDNGPFSAAAVVYNEKEFMHFHQPNFTRPDFRRKKWYAVESGKLLDQSIVAP